MARSTTPIGPRGRHHLAVMIAEPSIKAAQLLGRQYNEIVSNKLVVERIRAAVDGTIQEAIRSAVSTSSEALNTTSGAVTRREMLAKLRSAGVRIWNNDPDNANFDAGNDLPLPLRHVLTPDWVDKIFATFGAGLPWNGTKSQQETHFHRPLMTVPEALETIYQYKVTRDTLPRPDVWWWIRCADPYGVDCSLNVNSRPGYGVRVHYVSVQVAFPYVGAFPGE